MSLPEPAAADAALRQLQAEGYSMDDMAAAYAQGEKNNGLPAA